MTSNTQLVNHKACSSPSNSEGGDWVNVPIPDRVVGRVAPLARAAPIAAGKQRSSTSSEDEDWDDVPIPDRVVSRVAPLARAAPIAAGKQRSSTSSEDEDWDDVPIPDRVVGRVAPLTGLTGRSTRGSSGSGTPACIRTSSTALGKRRGSKSASGSGSYADEANSEEDEDDDDDEWGAFNITLTATKQGFATTSLSKETCPCSVVSSAFLGNSMFIPEPILNLALTKEKPKLNYLSEEELPPGTIVWVGDEEDVEVYIKKHWNVFYERICNGQRCGTVVRHSNDMTLVSFHDEDLELKYSLTLPRSCLSINEIDPGSFSGRFTVGKKEGLSTYFGKLNPRNTRCTSRESQLANQLFYEAVSLSTIRTDGCPALAKALEEFNNAAFSKAFTQVNNLIGWKDLHPSRVIDVFLLRSRLFVFQNKYEEAMEDAEYCIELEPRWVRGYLSAARALSGLGDFDRAHSMIIKANSILPYTTELRHIMELNTFLRSQQKMLKKRNLCLSLDHLYRKRVRPIHPVSEGQVLLMETVPSVITSSLFASWPEQRCKRCFKEYSDSVVEECSDEDSDADNLLSKSVCLDNVSKAMQRINGYCSVECRNESKEASRLREQHLGSVQRARTKLKSITSLILDSRPFEIANLTIRLFFIVVQKHKLLLETIAKRRRSIADFLVWSNSSDPPLGQRYTPSLNAALRHTGFFPLVNGHVGDSVKETVMQVYNILVENMNPEEQRLYNAELFLGLYRYVHAYYVSMKLTTSQNRKVPENFFFIPRFVGCIWGRSEIEWLARVEIDSGNWSSEYQLNFSLKTATNCGIELIDPRSKSEEESSKIICSSNSALNESGVPALALISKKCIDAYSLLVPI